MGQDIIDKQKSFFKIYQTIDDPAGELIFNREG
jgi:hypothetical protein